MEKIFTRRGTQLFIFTAGALAGLVTANHCAVAQEQQLPQITVTAPRVIHKVVGKSTAGIPIESTSVSYQVTFSDLDLTKPAGVSEIERRIDTMAKAACMDLDKLYPGKPDPHCVARAIASAGDQKKQAIAAAVAK